MDVINLQSLVQMIDRSHGYISLDRATEELRTEGTHFMGKVVTWVRFKFNREYREAVLLMESLFSHNNLFQAFYHIPPC